MKKHDYVRELEEYIPKKPTLFTSLALKIVTKSFCRNKDVTFKYEFDKKEIKGKQICLIADHCSRNAFYFVFGGFPFRRFNILMGYQNFFDKSMFKGSMWNGCIPKYLYSPDMGAVKSALRLAREGSDIMLFPEGIQSTIGSTHPMNPATLKFLKKLNMDIVLCSSKGSYLCNPRFTTEGFKKGHMEFTYKILYKKEELASLSVDEMYERYLKEFRYNDFLWNKEKQYSYTWEYGNAYGFDKLLYKCPICGKEECISIDGEYIVCNECGLRVHVDDKYNLESNKKLPFDRIDEWYMMQREAVREEVKKDFYMEFDVDYELLDTEVLHKPDDKCIKAGEGKLIIDNSSMRYKGTINGKDGEIIYEYHQIPSAPILPGRGIEVYRGPEFNQFFFKDRKNMSTKVMLVIEEAHNLVDPAWDKCSRDVYN